jgi:hypothetical protein
MVFSDEDEAEDDEILDTSWLTKFKEVESKYTSFYKEAITSIRLYVLYIKNNELIQQKTSRCMLDAANCLKRERIMALIHEYQEHDLTHYKLKSLLRYNIDLNPEEVSDFVNDEAVAQAATDRFLTSKKYLEDIHYNDSITMFRSLNALYFIFYADPAKSKTNTNTNTNTSTAYSALNQTKRIHLAKQHKTKRNKHKKNLKISKEIG